RDDEFSVRVDGRHSDLPLVAIEALEGAMAEDEPMPACEREVVDLIRAGIHAARCHLVQQRLPDMRLVSVDERDVGPRVAAELRWPDGELQPAGAAADDDCARPIIASLGHHPLCRLISRLRSMAIASAGFRPFGQTLAQLRIWRQP